MIKRIEIPKDVISLQRFFRELKLLTEDNADEDESDVPLSEQRWNAIRDNWSIVQRGIIGLVETIEAADKRIDERQLPPP